MAKSQRVQVTFTDAQIKIIDNIKKGALLGNTRAEVIKQIFLSHYTQYQG
jgi:hypothetical protein